MNALPADANQDGIVDIGDFGLLQVNYNQLDKLFTQGDFNGDGAVNGSDFAILEYNYEVNLQTASILADINYDGVVNDLDLNVNGLNAGMTNAAYEDDDLNGDGEVTQDDLDLPLAQYGSQYGSRWDWVDLVS